MLRRAAAVAAVLTLAACSPSQREATTEPSAASGFGAKPAEAREVEDFQFAMPSGNIGCFLASTSVRCDIGAKAWEPPPKPSDCELDWGSGLVVDAEGVTFACAGDTVLGGAEVLAYGESARAGDFICESSSANVRCRHVPSGRGFTLARERYTTF
jgi:hypothetical protein